MELRSAFIHTNEIVDREIVQYKKAVISDARFLGLTINLMLYIEAVFNLENPSLGDVAKHLNVTNASASTAVRKLIDSGFLKKVRSKSDKRVYHVRLTKKSKDLMCDEKAARDTFWDGLISPLSSEEQTLLLNAFEKIMVNKKV